MLAFLRDVTSASLLALVGLVAMMAVLVPDFRLSLLFEPPFSVLAFALGFGVLTAARR